MPYKDSKYLCESLRAFAVQKPLARYLLLMTGELQFGARLSPLRSTDPQPFFGSSVNALSFVFGDSAKKNEDAFTHQGSQVEPQAV